MRLRKNKKTGEQVQIFTKWNKWSFQGQDLSTHLLNYSRCLFLLRWDVISRVICLTFNFFCCVEGKIVGMGVSQSGTKVRWLQFGWEITAIWVTMLVLEAESAYCTTYLEGEGDSACWRIRCGIKKIRGVKGDSRILHITHIYLNIHDILFIPGDLDI